MWRTNLWKDVPIGAIEPWEDAEIVVKDETESLEKAAWYVLEMELLLELDGKF